MACACAVVGHFKAGHRVNIHYALHQPLDVLAEFLPARSRSINRQSNLFVHVVVVVLTETKLAKISRAVKVDDITGHISN